MVDQQLEKLQLLDKTIRHLKASNDYQWGHMGSCNCGFLAQEISRLNKHEIHRLAMQRHGDWNEQLNDYCPSSGLLMDDLITELLSAGFTLAELKHLEKLSDPNVLQHLPPEDSRPLQHNVKSDVLAYLKAWHHRIESDNATLTSVAREWDLVPA